MEKNIEIICHQCEISKENDKNKIMRACENVMKRSVAQNSKLFVTFSPEKKGNIDNIKCTIELNTNNGKHIILSGIGANCLQACKSGKDATLDKLIEKLDQEKL